MEINYEFDHYYSENQITKNECLKKCLEDKECFHITYKNSTCYFKGEEYKNATIKSNCPMSNEYDCYIFESKKIKDFYNKKILIM